MKPNDKFIAIALNTILTERASTMKGWLIEHDPRKEDKYKGLSVQDKQFLIRIYTRLIINVIIERLESDE